MDVGDEANWKRFEIKALNLVCGLLDDYVAQNDVYVNDCQFDNLVYDFNTGILFNLECKFWTQGAKAWWYKRHEDKNVRRMKAKAINEGQGILKAFFMVKDERLLYAGQYRQDLMTQINQQQRILESKECIVLEDGVRIYPRKVINIIVVPTDTLKARNNASLYSCACKYKFVPTHISKIKDNQYVTDLIGLNVLVRREVTPSPQRQAGQVPNVKSSRSR